MANAGLVSSRSEFALVACPPARPLAFSGTERAHLRGIRREPGVYFLSPEAADLPAVRARRTLFHLPGYPAAMTPVESKRTSPYGSRRHPGCAEFRRRHGPTTSPRVRDRGTSPIFRTLRHCLCTERRSRVHGPDIHHLPWPLEDAEIGFETHTVAAAAQLALPDTATPAALCEAPRCPDLAAAPRRPRGFPRIIQRSIPFSN